ncbi:MAG: hypothetical protein ABII76_27410 [Pseudomonadota bacterium]
MKKMVPSGYEIFYQYLMSRPDQGRAWVVCYERIRWALTAEERTAMDAVIAELPWRK